MSDVRRIKEKKVVPIRRPAFRKCSAETRNRIKQFMASLQDLIDSDKLDTNK